MIDFLNSIKKRDPAARSLLGIVLTYPGVKAVFIYRLASFFHIAGFSLLAIICILIGMFLTGRRSTDSI